ncbi:hypothetical protein [Actinoplanes siamensis]|uniref:Uncharacterized protein n=1 Tax=Actinoplanes siamensis TaxID=1223317 RepID=A0A919TM71_9ACTN|nr:hypothetical protein [Actinoplanes siamensis]GIF07239.1 hypothetical protein Asi03nite_47770 [Actinoplanes siamensis]
MGAGDEHRADAARLRAHELPDFREIAIRLAGELPVARHVKPNRAGHPPGPERPEPINRLLTDFPENR